MDELIEKARETNPRAYEPWEPREDQKLFDRWNDGIEDRGILSQEFGRSESAMQRRLEFLDLLPMSERRVSLIKRD